MPVEKNIGIGGNGERRESSSYAGNFEILSPGDFFLDFQTRAVNARSRALAQTMYVEPGEAFSTIIGSLKQARANGAHAVLSTDYYSFMVDEQQLAYIPSLNRAMQRARKDQRALKKDMIRDLEDTGVSVVVTNPPTRLERILPFKGRNHIKLALVDDTAWVGGLSYRDADLDKEDFMMRITDPKIVDVLADVFYMVNERRPAHDLRYQVDDETTVIVDCGDGGSTIFDHSLELVEGATDSIRFATQYSPNGAMVNKFFAKHKEGKSVSAVISANEAIVEWYGRFIDRVNIFTTKVKRKNIPFHFSRTRVHAKAILVDEDIPDKAVGMVGSHNLTRSGVLLGTQELGVFSTNSKFVSNLKHYFDELEAKVASQEGNK